MTPKIASHCTYSNEENLFKGAGKVQLNLRKCLTNNAEQYLNRSVLGGWRKTCYTLVVSVECPVILYKGIHALPWPLYQVQAARWVVLFSFLFEQENEMQSVRRKSKCIYQRCSMLKKVMISMRLHGIFFSFSFSMTLKELILLRHIYNFFH